eukprot:8392397-Alexandrium_andersonii.AAC.1
MFFEVASATPANRKFQDSSAIPLTSSRILIRKLVAVAAGDSRVSVHGAVDGLELLDLRLWCARASVRTVVATMTRWEVQAISDQAALLDVEQPELLALQDAAPIQTHRPASRTLRPSLADIEA